MNVCEKAIGFLVEIPNEADMRISFSSQHWKHTWEFMRITMCDAYRKIRTYDDTITGAGVQTFVRFNQACKFSTSRRIHLIKKHLTANQCMSFAKKDTLKHGAMINYDQNYYSTRIVGSIYYDVKIGLGLCVYMMVSDIHFFASLIFFIYL